MRQLHLVSLSFLVKFTRDFPRRPVTRWVLFCLLSCSASFAYPLDVTQLPPSSFDTPTIAGRIQHPDLRELSGLNRSGHTPGRLWAINDSGAEPLLYALNESGESLGSFTVTGATNYDWEDLTVATLDGLVYLVIADIGDNVSRRPHVTLYFVAEPLTLKDTSGTKSTSGKRATLPVAFRWTFRYEDGARNAESIAFDHHNRSFLILSKRDVPARLYQLDIDEKSPTNQRIARRIATLESIPQPEWNYLLRQPITGTFASQPTAMDLAPDGSMLAVLTYRFAYLYRRPLPAIASSATDAQPEETAKLAVNAKPKKATKLAAEAKPALSSGRKPATPVTAGWQEIVKRPPELIVFPPLLQAEAITFDFSGQSLYISSEFTRPPLLRIDQSKLQTLPAK